MFMVTASFHKRCKSIYLPESNAWNNSWSFTQNETGLSSDLTITLRALDDQWYIAAPKGWKWKNLITNDVSTGELCFNGTDCSRFMLVQGEISFLFVVSEYQKENTCLLKYRLRGPQIVDMGRNKQNTICISDASVSDKQASLVFQNSQNAKFTDNSTNGSYVNGKLIHRASHDCKFGDTIFILPNFRLIFLGDMVAISKSPSLLHVQLPDVIEEPQAIKQQEEVVEDTVVDYLRAPRIMDKPDTEPLEIEPPIAKADGKNTPLILTIGPSLTMIFPMLMGSFVSQINNPNGSFMASGLAMMGTSALLATGWALANGRYRKNQEKGNEKKRLHLYASYIKDREQKLSVLNDKEFKRLTRMYVDAEECLKMVTSQSERLWERLPSHSDFMDVRIGTGNVELPNPLKIPPVKLSLIDDPMRHEPDRLKRQYGKVRNAPVCIPFRREKLVGLLGNTSAVSTAFSILINLAAMHSYHNVKIMVLTDEQHYSQWQWVRWLPHAFSNENRTLRMVAASQHALSEVLFHLDELLSMRANSQEDADRKETDDDEIENPRELPLPHYVIFCTNHNLLKNEPILKRIIASKPIGITLICLAPTMNELPKECGMVINCRKEKSGLYDVNGDVTPAKLDYASLQLANQFAKGISGIRSYDNDGNAAVPMLVKFLSMYGVKKAEELDIWRWWNENHAYDGLQAVIGLRAGGVPFILDISDRHHGPHGLVAGTTGSGKSVMLQSYILSLALNYSPKEVQFVLIDYKGGGMAAAFTDLPHVAGSIDNLQGLRTIRRALASIQGEIKRREQIFKDVGVSNIDEYIRYFNNEPGNVPLGHLIIIVDEFAELRKEQPEFMRELISASRVGRSVGVHLILATQKPSNSVDDEIWSNARFHICLRVQTRMDSMDMLKRPDAAYIRGMGRCFVQVGNDELFETVQTSWSSAPYEPNKIDFDDKPYLLNDVGQPIVIRSEKKQNKNEKQETQMEAILKHMRRIADEHGIANTQKLWLDELDKVVALDGIDLYRRRGFANGRWLEQQDEQIRAVIGLADDLMNQLHIPVEIDLTGHKNHLVVGLSGTGKTTFIQTLAMALAATYTPERLQMYFISPSTHVLSSLSKLPHTGEMLFEDDKDETIRLLHMLRDESNRRRNLFAKSATDNFVVYNRTLRQTGQGGYVPAIVVFVDRFGQLDEMLNDDDKQVLHSLLKDASSRGIYFVATALAINEVFSRIRGNFFKIALQLQERAEYSEVLSKRLPSEMNDISPYPGRGAIVMDENVYEMQIALFGGAEIDTDRSALVEQTAQAMSEAWQGEKPMRIPRIPAKPVLKDLISTAKANGMDEAMQLPIGYLKLEGIPYMADLNRQYAWLASGARQSGKTTFLKGVAQQFALRNAEIHVIGDAQWSIFANTCNAAFHSLTDTEGINAFVVELNQEILNRNAQRKAQPSDEHRLKLQRQFKPYVIIIDDLAQLLGRISPEAEHLLSLCCSSAAGFGIYLFASMNTKTISQIRNRELLQALAATGNGLALCGKLNENDIWDVQTNYATKGKIFPVGEAYMVVGSKVRHVVIPF